MAGYATSAVAKPFFILSQTWVQVAIPRWLDRAGKGIRTSPRDALVADSVSPKQRGAAFGVHRAADTAGALCSMLIALLVVWLAQKNGAFLAARTFRIVVLVSIAPAILAVLALALGAQEVKVSGQRSAPKFAFRSLGRPFMVFMGIISVFTLGNSSDAFLTLRAQSVGQGLNVLGILGMLATFNLVYTLVSAPAGSLSDRVGRQRVIVCGWLAYALIYIGFGVAGAGWQVWALYGLYGIYYGMSYGTASAFIADLVPADVRGTAYGTYNAIISVLALIASVVAGVLWQGIGSWHGLGAPAPFLFGGVLALVAAIVLFSWRPQVRLAI